MCAICHVNVQCISNKLSEIEILVLQNNIDILCISEHWLSYVNISNIYLPGFKLAANFSRKEHIHGGSLIFVKNSLIVNEVKLLNEISLECQVEMCGISFKGWDNKKVLVICLYRPPNGVFSVFHKHLSEVLKILSLKFDYIVLCGDFNVDYLKITLNKKVLCDMLESYELRVTSTDPTRISHSNNGQVSATCIDYMTTNFPENICNIKTINPLIADHLAHVLTICHDNIKPSHKVEKMSIRVVNDNSLNEFNFHLQNTDWSPLYSLSVNKAFGYFLNCVVWCLEVSCPIKSITKSVGERNEKSWVSEEIISEGNQIKKLYWEMKNTCDPMLASLYNQKKKEYRKNINTAKETYFSNKIRNANNKTKETWGIINRRLGRTKNENDVITLKVNNNIITDKNKVANLFCTHFASTAINKVSDFFSYNLSLPCTLSENIMESIYIEPISANELHDVIRNLKNKKSSGIDGVTLQIVKGIIQHLETPLLYLFNSSLNNGIFPDCLKISSVIPVFKNGNKDDIENYRQIHLLSVFSKLLEKFTTSRVLEFLKLKNVLTPCQHGFRPGKSTETASFYFIDYIYKNLDQGKYVVSILFDLTSAFDTVNNAFLAIKLENIGIRGKILDWIISYMSTRKLTVKYQNVVSDLNDVNLGVPQGSVLGPLLFSLYINDLPKYFNEGHVTMYADDTAISVCASTPEELYLKIGYVCETMSAWCQRNRLILNEKKTKYINFNLRRPLTEDLIPFSASLKYLGTYLDNNLSWICHIDHVCKQLNKAYYAILQMKNTLRQPGLLNIYYALAYSYISSNIIMWGKSTDFNRVFILQKRILRLIFNMKYNDTCRNVFKENEILTVPSVYIYKCLLFARDNMALFDTLDITHSYNTRHGNLYAIPPHKTSTFKDSPYYNSIIFYNNLPKNVRDLQYRQYKKKVRKLLVEKNCYSVHEFLDSC